MICRGASNSEFLGLSSQSTGKQPLDGMEIAGDGWSEGELIQWDTVGRHGDAEYLGAVGGFHTKWRVFEHDGVGSGGSRAPEHFEDEVGMRLAARHIVNADDGVEVAGQAEARQAPVDVRARPGCRHRQQIAARL